MRRIIKFIFWRNSRFEFLFIQDKRAIVRLLLCLLFASIVSVEWPWLDAQRGATSLAKKKYRLFHRTPRNNEDIFDRYALEFS